MNQSQAERSLSIEPRHLLHPLSQLRSYLQRIYVDWSDWRRRGREVAVLDSFSDRDLWDIGLGRSDLQAIRAGCYRRDC